MKNLSRLFVAATAAAISLSGLAACKSAEPYAAKVNGVVLSKSGLDDELNAIRNNKDYVKALSDSGVTVEGKGDATFDSAFVARVLTRRIYLELVHEEVVKRKLKITKADLSAAKSQLASSVGDAKVLDQFPKAYLNEIERTTAEVSKLQEALSDSSPAALQKYYDEHKDQFASVCAAHILVATKDEADGIEKDLKKATDKKAKFAEIAKAKSTDTGSGANGGDLGCAAPTQYVAEFAQAVETQPVGEIGDPVKTQYGYHIIRVDSRVDAKPYDEVKDQVKAAVTQDAQAPFNDFLSNASTKAKVEVNPRYGKYDTSGQSPQIVPPDQPKAATTTTLAP